MKPASKFEIVAARCWNVLNEGKSFHPVFVLGVFFLLHALELGSGEFWGRALPALLLTAPLVVLFVHYDFPLKLRWALWGFLVVFVLVFRFVDVGALAFALGLYVFFTVFFWGTFYYHLRTGAPKTNFVRFWRLVLENPDSTSGNFLEQMPKALLALFTLEYLIQEPLDAGRISLVLLFTAALGMASYLIHRKFFDWGPIYPMEPTRGVNDGAPLARRVIVVVIDGCRLDRFREAEKPYLEKMMASGTVYESVETTYPARTVVCFSSMLTGAAPERHGITSNLVLKLGLKVESIFDVLRRRGKVGRLVGIAHLIDAFGDDVASVTSVAHNDKI
ncbi:MAG: alkaline phosphatase family protein, partial [Actinomycetota bacterium]|nr:alkaline phosphatase family protein [Actinomycetota bacterium]